MARRKNKFGGYGSAHAEHVRKLGVDSRKAAEWAHEATVEIPRSCDLAYDFLVGAEQYLTSAKEHLFATDDTVQDKEFEAVVGVAHEVVQDAHHAFKATCVRGAKKSGH